AASTPCRCWAAASSTCAGSSRWRATPSPERATGRARYHTVEGGMIIDLATMILLLGLPTIVGIIAEVEKGRRGLAWAVIGLSVEALLVLLALAGTPFDMANSHGNGTLALAALCGFIVMLGVVGSLPHRSEAQQPPD